MREARDVPVEDLHVHPYNKTIYGEPDDGLVDSIREFGLRRPIRINEERAILSGARRWTAFQSLERSTIPAVKMDLPSEEAERKEVLLANAYRGEKSPEVRMQEADAYYEMLREGEVSKDDLRDAAHEQDTEPQDDRPFCLAAAAAGLNKTDYNGLQRIYHSDRLEEDIARAERDGKIEAEVKRDLFHLLTCARDDVRHGTASPSTAARRISEALDTAMEADNEPDGGDEDDEGDAGEESERKKASEALELAHRRGKQFIEALREVNEKHSHFLELEDATAFRRLLAGAHEQVDALAKAAGWGPEAEGTG